MGKPHQRPLVFVSGCFDVLHVGHLRLLKEARKLGNTIVVGMPSDEAVRAMKGNTRPRNTSGCRRDMLLALMDRETGMPLVDEVWLHSHESPEQACVALRPDVLVKGADWRGKHIPEAAHCASVHYVERVDGVSSTEIIGDHHEVARAISSRRKP